MPQSSSMQQRFFVWLSDNPGEARFSGEPAMEPSATADENVTSLSSARQLK